MSLILAKEHIMNKVAFHDPHPGIGGAASPLPATASRAVKRIQLEANTVDEAVSILSSETKARGNIVVQDDCILYKVGSFKDNDFPVHCWRVIKFSEVK
jgi:hypothetical protein